MWRSHSSPQCVSVPGCQDPDEMLLPLGPNPALSCLHSNEQKHPRKGPVLNLTPTEGVYWSTYICSRNHLNQPWQKRKKTVGCVTNWAWPSETFTSLVGSKRRSSQSLLIWPLFWWMPDLWGGNKQLALTSFWPSVWETTADTRAGALKDTIIFKKL